MDDNSSDWSVATRKAGLDQLAAFRSRMGKRYASGRNYDRGPGRHTAVSCLSPYVRRRLVLEEELVDAALAAHGLNGAEKFIQEVFWRSYFKGWLERRPSVWQSYREGLSADLVALETDHQLAKRVAAAEDGRTGIACFDAWAQELVDTGYLHNHARMWFASIWIFTLELPWRIGADFFYRHLLDGDPASNTLSWRWVAGLHTRGKVYQAQAWNIAKFTSDRFHPRADAFADGIQGLESTEPHGLPDPRPVRKPVTLEIDRPTVVLITEEDCHPESWTFDLRRAAGFAVLSASHLRSERAIADRVIRFEEDALRGTAERIGVKATWLEARSVHDVVRWAGDSGASQIVTGYIPEGPLQDWIRDASPILKSAGIRIAELRRDWDTAIWPHATGGFFKVKKKIPGVLRDLGLEDREPLLL